MKIRNKKITRPVTVERGGREYTVNESVTLREPVVRDMDVIVGRAVAGATLLIVIIALTWSVVSIGDLLSTAAPAWAAYLVAGAFDLSWAVCMAAEWRLRYDRRSVIPQRAGWAMLAVSMAAIATHGALQAGVLIGIIGAAVSLLAKSLWAVMLMTTAHPLSEIDSQIVEQRRSEISGELALATVERELIRTTRTTAAIAASGSLVEAAWEASGLSRAQLAQAVTAQVSRAEPEPEPSAQAADLQRLTAIRERLTARGPALTGGSAAQLSESAHFVPAAQGEPVSPAHEPVSREPGADVRELVRRLNDGERLTKRTAAGILGVSEATAGRRLREARDLAGGGYM